MRTSQRVKHINEYYFAAKLREIRHRQSAGEHIINLGIGNPDLQPPKDVVDQLLASTNENGSFAYKPYLGIPDLRLAMAKFYQKLYGVSMEPEGILPLIGSKEGIAFISQAYLDPGDEVLIPDPGYPAYEAAARMAGGVPVKFDITPELGWHPDPLEIERRISEKTRIIWLNYPNMPTGALPRPRELGAIVEIARGNDIIVCHDNPYSLILAESPFSMLSLGKDNVIELNSLSKSFNMAGARVGMLCGRQELIDPVFKIQSNYSSGMFYPVQRAAITALGLFESEWSDSLNKKYYRRRRSAHKILDLLGSTYELNSAGMFVWGKIPEKFTSGLELSELILNKAQVFVTPGQVFGANGNEYIRISLCAPEEQINEAASRIRTQLEF